VRVEDGIATPILSKSNLIFSLVRANGLLCIPIGVEEIATGVQVDVMRLE
jgi:molybdopterin biosynthesis enzyme